MIHIPVSYWIAFGVFVTTVLILDLCVFHREAKEATTRQSALWTVAWCSLAVIFAGFVWWLYEQQAGAGEGTPHAVLFMTGYLVEWSLSMDNVFVFVVIFNHFKIPLKYQYRVLFWGIIGAVVLRLAFILAGVALVKNLEWVLYLLGAFLIYTGIMVAIKDEDFDPEQSRVLRWSRKLLPVAPGDHEVHAQRFFVKIDGRWMITPLFLVLIVVDAVDVVFAVDSVPAIFLVTQDPFIVFTSNVFAILGLRALYFLLADFMGMFHYLKYGLSAILIFVGGKMMLKLAVAICEWRELPGAAHTIESFEPSALMSLLIILALLGSSILASILLPAREEKK